MGTQSKCNGCGTVTEMAEGMCPVCGGPATVDRPQAAAATTTAAAPLLQPPPFHPETAVHAAPAPEAAQQDPRGDGPPTPAARPDPYAQFGNPLHDTWGDVTPVVRPTHPKPHTARRKRPWATRILVVLVLVVLAGAAWINRTWLDETWDSVYDQVDEWTNG